MRTGKFIFKLHTIIAIFACTVVALSLLVTDILISNRISEQKRNELSDHALEIARIVARSPTVIEARFTNTAVYKRQLRH